MSTQYGLDHLLMYEKLSEPSAAKDTPHALTELKPYRGSVHSIVPIDTTEVGWDEFMEREEAAKHERTRAYFKRIAELNTGANSKDNLHLDRIPLFGHPNIPQHHEWVQQATRPSGLVAGAYREYHARTAEFEERLANGEFTPMRYPARSLGQRQETSVRILNRGKVPQHQPWAVMAHGKEGMTLSSCVPINRLDSCNIKDSVLSADINEFKRRIDSTYATLIKRRRMNTHVAMVLASKHEEYYFYCPRQGGRTYARNNELEILCDYYITDLDKFNSEVGFIPPEKQPWNNASMQVNPSKHS